MADNKNLVTQEDLDNLAQLESKLTNVNERLDEFLQQIDKLNSSLTRSGTSYQKIAAAAEEYEKVTEGVSNALKEQHKAVSDINTLKQKVINTDTQLSKVRQQEVKSLKDITESGYERAVEGIQQMLLKYAELDSSLKATRKELKELEKINEQGRASEEGYLNQKALLIGVEKEQSQELRVLNNLIKANNQIVNTQIGSYDNLSAQYSALKIVVNSLDDSESANGYTKQELTEQLNKLYEAMNQYQLSTGKAALQVGNYQLANIKATESINDQSQTLVRYQADLDATRERLNTLEKQYKAGNTTETEYSKIKSSLIIQEREQARLVREQNKVVKQSVSAQAELKQQYEELTEVINNLSESETHNGQTKQELIALTERMRKALNEYSLSTSNVKLETDRYEDTSRDLLGTIGMTIPGVGNLTGQVNKLSGAFKALLANPVVGWLAPLVAIIGASVAVFNRSIDAVKNNERQYVELQAAISPLAALQANTTRGFERIGNAIVETTGKIAKFVTSLNIVKAVFGDFDEESKRFEEIILERQELRQRQREFNIDEAKEMAEIARLKADATNVDKFSAEERIKFLDDAFEKEKNLAKERKAIAEAYLRDLTKTADATKDNSTKARDDINKAQVAVINATTQLSEVERQYNRERTRISGTLRRDIAAEERERQRLLAEEKKRFNEQTQLIQLRATEEAEASRQIMLNTKREFGDRITSAYEYYFQQIKLVETLRERQLMDQELTETGRQLIIEKANAEIRKITEQQNNALIQLEGNFRKQLQDSIQRYQTNELDDILIKQRNDELAIEQAFASGQIKNRAAYQEALLSIEQKYAEERFNVELETLNQLSDLYVDDKEQFDNIQNQILRLKKSYQAQQTEEARKGIKKRSEEEIEEAKKVQQALKSLYQQLYSTVFSLIDSALERQINSIDRQLDELSQFYEEKTKLIEEQENAGLITSEYADFMREYYADQELRRQEELEDQKKQIQRKQAKYEKAQAIASAGINTAKAIVEALPNLILAGIVAATGAAQIAAIAAQPLPEYAEGTSDHIGGAAIVGDGGRAEMIRTPDGSIFKTPSVPTLVDLPKHSEVFPDFSKEVKNMHDRDMKQILIMNDGKQVMLLRRNLSASQSSANYQREILSYQKKNNKILMRNSTQSKINALVS